MTPSAAPRDIRGIVPAGSVIASSTSANCAQRDRMSAPTIRYRPAARSALSVCSPTPPPPTAVINTVGCGSAILGSAAAADRRAKTESTSGATGPHRASAARVATWMSNRMISASPVASSNSADGAQVAAVPWQTAAPHVDECRRHAASNEGSMRLPGEDVVRVCRWRIASRRCPGRCSRRGGPPGSRGRAEGFRPATQPRDGPATWRGTRGWSATQCRACRASRKMWSRPGSICLPSRFASWLPRIGIAPAVRMASRTESPGR